MCEDEYRLNTGTLTTHQKWNVDDTLQSGKNLFFAKYSIHLFLSLFG